MSYLLSIIRVGFLEGGMGDGQKKEKNKNDFVEELHVRLAYLGVWALLPLWER